MAVGSGGSFQAAAPKELFAGPYLLDNSGSQSAPNYDVAPDGARLLMIKRQPLAVDGPRPEITVVLNWFKEVTEKIQPR